MFGILAVHSYKPVFMNVFLGAMIIEMLACLGLVVVSDWLLLPASLRILVVLATLYLKNRSFKSAVESVFINKMGSVTK